VPTLEEFLKKFKDSGHIEVKDGTPTSRASSWICSRNIRPKTACFWPQNSRGRPYMRVKPPISPPALRKEVLSF